MNAWAKLLCLLLIVVTGGSAFAATNEESQPAQAMVRVARLGAGVTAPEPIPPAQPLVVPEKCKGKLKGTVRLSVIVDARGVPQNIRLLEPLGTDLDKLALLYLDAERFKPGTVSGQPAAVGQAVAIELSACGNEGPKQNKRRTQILHLRALPTQKFFATDSIPSDVIFGPSVVQNMTGEFNAKNLDKFDPEHKADTKDPSLLKYVEARYSEEARNNRVMGTTVISLVVDSNGMPEKVRVVRPLGSGLDEEAMYAVSMYRFSPGLRHGSPVAVMISVQVNFKLY